SPRVSRTPRGSSPTPRPRTACTGASPPWRSPTTAGSTGSASVAECVGGQLGPEPLIVTRLEVRRDVPCEQLERSVPPVDRHPLPRVEQQRSESADRLLELAHLARHVLG